MNSNRKRQYDECNQESIVKKSKKEVSTLESTQYFLFECEECLCPFKNSVDFYIHMIDFHGYTKFKDDLMEELKRIKEIDKTTKNVSIDGIFENDNCSDNYSLMKQNVKSIDTIWENLWEDSTEDMAHKSDTCTSVDEDDNIHTNISESLQIENNSNGQMMLDAEVMTTGKSEKNQRNSVDISNYMSTLANELLQKSVNIPVLKITAIQDAFPDINKIINEENELILRNILIVNKEDYEQNGDTAKSCAAVKEPKLYELLKSCESIPRTIVELEKTSTNFMTKIWKKQDLLNKARKKKIKEDLAKEKKNDLSWHKLMNIENSIENQVEKHLHHEMLDIDDQISLSSEISDDDQIPLEEDINLIIDKCSSNTFELIIAESNNGWPTVISDINSQSVGPVKATYDCNFCQSWSSKKYSDFYSHIKLHLSSFNSKSSKQYPQSCVICGYIIPSSDLKKHMMKHINHSRCSLCNEFVAFDDVETHKNIHAKQFMCGICGDLYKTKAAINKHLMYHTKGSEYSCEECNTRFGGLEKLVRHINQKHMSIDPIYSECPYCLNLTTSIKNHLYSADVCKLKCKVCLKVEKTNEDFIKHMKRHSAKNTSRLVNTVVQVKNLDCPDCNMKLSNEGRLHCHKYCHYIHNLYSEHQKLKERMECEICGTAMLKSHYYLHKNKHVIYDRCHICFKFVSKNSFKDHVDCHELEYCCDICGQLFNIEEKMISHRFAHGRLVEHPCSECELNFCSELSRAKHISLIHKNIDPEFVECYFCKELICGKIEYHLFDYNVCLRRCKLCNVRYRSEYSFLEHVLKAHHDLLDHSIKLNC